MDACSVVMSRIQPWWGGSLVPFVDQAHGAAPWCEIQGAPGKPWPSTHRIPAQKGAGGSEVEV